MLVNNERSLAHIEKVKWIKKIEGADNIELVGILGWECIAKKGEFKEGDLAVYIEIDSKVPAVDPFMFLSSKDFKVKTMKLGKFNVISQGLALPVSSFSNLTNINVGDDVTSILGIKKIEEYEVEKIIQPVATKNKFVKFLMRFSLFRKILLSKNKDSKFPKEISKTDEERVENIPHVLESQNEWVATEKIDGTSSTYLLRKKGFWIFKKYEFVVCSRNRIVHDKNTVYWENAEKYDIKNKLKKYLKLHKSCRWVCIQGESIGPNIQGNKYKRKESELYIFNFIDSVYGRWNSLAADDIVKGMDMKFVPILGILFLPKTMEDMKKQADGISKLYDCLREGIVYRELKGIGSFKNVSKEFLVKNKL